MASTAKALASPGSPPRKLSSLAIHADVAESIAAIKLAAQPPTAAAPAAAGAAPLPDLLSYAAAPSPAPRSPSARSPTAGRRAASSRFDADGPSAGSVAAALRAPAFDISGRAIQHGCASAPAPPAHEAAGGCWAWRAVGVAMGAGRSGCTQREEALRS